MKIKVSETTPLQLNWLMAVCEFPNPDYCDDDRLVYVTCEPDYGMGTYSPSTDWSQGGPIIARERIDLFTEKYTPEAWFASIARHQNGGRLTGWRLHQYGPTPLIAAMRVYVASKLGDEVEIPEELK